MDEHRIKTFRLNSLDEETGEFDALFCRFDDLDKYNEVTSPGAIGVQKVLISPYDHKLWEYEMPVGKGITYETAEYAGVKGQFFLDTTSGRDTYNVVKNVGDQQEWSYGFFVRKWEYKDFNGKERFHIQKAEVLEVSPVFRGAGNRTQTLEVKSEPTTFTITDLGGILRARHTLEA